MEMFFIQTGAYVLGCIIFMMFFFVGRWPALIEETNWSWPVIFLWPLLVFWPAYFLKRQFSKWMAGQRGRAVPLAAAISCVPKLVSDVNVESKSSVPLA